MKNSPNTTSTSPYPPHPPSVGPHIIQSDLLNDLLSDHSEKKIVPKFKATWSSEKYVLVRGFLSWLAMRSLNIERLPWTPIWPFTLKPTPNNHLLEGLTELREYLYRNPACVDDACKELREIHEFTKKYYKNLSNGGNTIKLGRAYKNLSDTQRQNALKELEFIDPSTHGKNTSMFASILAQKSYTAQQLGLPTIKISHDVITSWNRSGKYSKRDVSILMDIPIESLLCTYETIQSKHKRSNGNRINGIEDGEFLVLNRDWNGFFEVPTASVFTDSSFNFYKPQPEEWEIYNNTPFPQSIFQESGTTCTEIILPPPPRKAKKTLSERFHHGWSAFCEKSKY